MGEWLVGELGRRSLRGPQNFLGEHLRRRNCQAQMRSGLAGMG